MYLLSFVVKYFGRKKKISYEDVDKMLPMKGNLFHLNILYLFQCHHQKKKTRNGASSVKIFFSRPSDDFEMSKTFLRRCLSFN